MLRQETKSHKKSYPSHTKTNQLLSYDFENKYKVVNGQFQLLNEKLHN